MAVTVTHDTLRELAKFRAGSGCAISLYVDLDPTDTPTPADAQTRFNAALNEAEKSEAANRGELTHEQREGLRADFDRMRRYFSEEFSREGAHGLALFAAGLDGFWRPLPLPGRVADAAAIDDSFHLAPLVPLVGRGDGALVAVVNRERGDVYRLRDGRLVEVADHTEEQPRRHDQGGWSQARFQRHIDELAADHMRAVAEEVARQVRRSDNGLQVVIVCAEENRPQFVELLPQEATQALAGWVHAEAHAGPADLLAAVLPVLDRARLHGVHEALERWRAEAGKNGRAASGWKETLEAASDARVDVLLAQEGARREAWECPRCGRGSAEPGECPLDGAELRRERDGLDLAVRHTLAHGGNVLNVERRDDGPPEGIGALLRF
jgi:peptide chain release factor subunit 1